MENNKTLINDSSPKSNFNEDYFFKILNNLDNSFSIFTKFFKRNIAEHKEKMLLRMKDIAIFKSRAIFKLISKYLDKLRENQIEIDKSTKTTAFDFFSSFPDNDKNKLESADDENDSHFNFINNYIQEISEGVERQTDSLLYKKRKRQLEISRDKYLFGVEAERTKFKLKSKSNNENNNNNQKANFELICDNNVSLNLERERNGNEGCISNSDERNQIVIEELKSESQCETELDELLFTKDFIEFKNTKMENESEDILIVKKKCHICNKKISKKSDLHFFYYSFCFECGDFNYRNRFKTVDLTGKIAIVTGGRVKIGYEIVLKLLQFNCKVIMTTRFPKDALDRFKREESFGNFKNNLIIYPLDLRIMQSLFNFIEFVYKNFTHVDILINNAAQTNRRSADYYKYLLDNEVIDETQKQNAKGDGNDIIIKDEYLTQNKFVKKVGNEYNVLSGLLNDNFHDNDRQIENCNNINFSVLKPNLLSSFDSILEENGDSNNSSNSSQALCKLISPNNALSNNLNICSAKSEKWALPLSVLTSQMKLFNDTPSLSLDAHISNFYSQPFDFNTQKTSWNQQIDEVNIIEFAETQIINCWAPFILISKLKKLFTQSKSKNKYIVNVSSMEGVFDYLCKKTTHPHTNMAKAGLNMITRTCAKYCKNDEIYLCSVDTGWVSMMNGLNDCWDFEDEFCRVPLDELDGAMRVLFPIIEGEQNNNFYYGCFLKNYKISRW